MAKHGWYSILLSQIVLPGKAFMSRISGMLSGNRSVIGVTKFVETDIKDWVAFIKKQNV